MDELKTIFEVNFGEIAAEKKLEFVESVLKSHSKKRKIPLKELTEKAVQLLQDNPKAGIYGCVNRAGNLILKSKRAQKDKGDTK